MGSFCGHYPEDAVFSNLAEKVVTSAGRRPDSIRSSAKTLFVGRRNAGLKNVEVQV